MRFVAAFLVVLVIACTPPPPSAIETATEPPIASATPLDWLANAAWRRVADIPTPRSEVATAVLRGLIYVVGGSGGPNRVERFDPASNRWERVADLPIAVDHAMAAVVEGVNGPVDEGLYVLGGNAPDGVTARAFRFDPVSERWEEAPSMPSPRSAGAAVAIDDRIYVVGGADGSRLVPPTYEFNATTRTWRIVAAILTPRDHVAAALFSGSVCAIGGRRLSMSLNLGTFECYNPGLDRWEALPGAPTARGGVGAAVVDDQLYFIGGEQPSGTFREVELYDRITRSWRRGPDLPTPRHGIGVAVVGRVLYVLTGGPTPGGSQTPIVEALDIGTFRN